MKKYTTEVIELYLEGRLDKVVHEELEAAMMGNQELKEEVALQQAIVLRLKRHTLQASVSAAHERFMNGSRFGFQNGSWKWIGGLLLAGTVIALLYLNHISTKDIEPQVASTYISSEDTSRVVPDKRVIPNKPDQVEKSLRPTGASVRFNVSDSVSAISRQVPASTPAVKIPLPPLPEVSFHVSTFLAQRGTTITFKRSGTVITIPPNSLRNSKGQIVSGAVQLKYREFRNQADIALSGIPMTYKDQNFNSAGMFEMHALQGQDTLEIAKDKQVMMDFVMTKNEPGIGFYRLKQPENKWEMVHSQESEVKRIFRESVADVEKAENEARKVARDELKKRLPSKFSKKGKEDIDEMNIRSAPLQEEINSKSPPSPVSKDTYRSVIQKLYLSGFGIYNCDQVYRMQQPVVIEGSYYDEEKKPLTQLKNLSVIDKKVNAAFSFDPHRFTWSAASATVILLFTQDNKVYYLDASQWPERDRQRAGKHTLVMKEITDRLKSPGDLQAILDKGL